MRFPFVILALIGLPSLAHSQFLSPGPLAAPHQRYEGVTKCTLCHALGTGIPDEKCLSCHTEIGGRLASRKGYHDIVRSKECAKCHADHKGVPFDMTGLTRLPFDHKDSGWPLTGAHIKTKCEACHTTNRVDVESKRPTNRRTYLGAATTCKACHPDIHKSSKETFQQCETCHSTANWTYATAGSRFRHDRDSRYKLTGAHARVDCYGCHKQKTWAPQPFASCMNCHADPHKGKLGPKCESCHSTFTWKTSSAAGGGGKKGAFGFDHNRTAFPLLGGHQKVTCEACHGKVPGKIKGFERCEHCHTLNPHGEQFGILWDKKKACADCHLADGWTILSFVHNRDSRYKIEGKHTDVPCRQCHLQQTWRWMTGAPDCSSCHLDVHKGQFTSPCIKCHTEKGFSETLFDHGRTRFPLMGKHQKVACALCHIDGKYKDVSTECQDCHNDFHETKLGKECKRCHAPTDFRDVEFDHNREARFKLEGQHTKVPCNQCHLSFVYQVKDKTCGSCHLDVHKKKKGPKCENCHTTTTFVVEKK